MKPSTKTLIFILIFFVASVTDSWASIMVLNGLTHERQVSPGDRYVSGIEIQNASDQVKSVRLYQVDYRYVAGGESFYDEPGTLPRSNARWVEVSSLMVTLQPNETRTVDFEVLVPQDDSLNGTYWSVIMVEGIEADPTKPQSGVSIQTVMRYAIQVITHIGETGNVDLQFLKMELKKENNMVQLEVDIENTGERAVRPEVGISLFDASENPVQVVTAERKRIYPGSSVRFVLNIDYSVPGQYSGILVADCDEEHVFGANVNLEI